MTFALTHLKIDTSLGELLEMMTYKRPSFSQTEEDFIDRFLLPFDPMFDGFGNAYVEVGENSRIMFSSHTDTVHHKPGRQKTIVVGDIVKVDDPKGQGTNCLGADCTTGVWLMMEMIRAGKPGLYIFHRAEETGGGGSNYIAKQHPEYLQGIEIAIAFDRKGYDSVITHQAGGRCASDAFAEQLAALLGGAFKPDDTGVFTDTANYTDLIGECTNISVGYHMQHGPMESQDLRFAAKLRDTLLAADFSTLIAHRAPGEVDEDDFTIWWKDYKSHQPSYSSPLLSKELDLLDYVTANPRAITNFLLDMGYSIEDFE